MSRHHGRLIARQGALVYSDLASTNGSRVNGVEIDEVVLGRGIGSSSATRSWSSSRSAATDRRHQMDGFFVSSGRPPALPRTPLRLSVRRRTDPPAGPAVGRARTRHRARAPRRRRLALGRSGGRHGPSAGRHHDPRSGRQQLDHRRGPFASSDHAMLTFRGRAWYVEDRESTNGTFVNGSRVTGWRRSASATSSRSARSGSDWSDPRPPG